MQFFALEKLPFRLRPDPEFLFAGAGYVRASNSVMVGLEQNSRTHLLIGRAGLGKTVLLNDMLSALGALYSLCRINQPRMSAGELLEAMAMQLDSPLAELDIDRPAPPLLAVDDAHLLPSATLRSLNELLLRIPHLKLILCGRSGQRLEERAVTLLTCEQPKITRMAMLSAEETRLYINHRMVIAGADRRELITPEAHALIYQHTAGAPRLINVLCDAALQTACLRAAGQVGSAEVLVATQDGRWPEAVASDRPDSPVREFIEDLAEPPAASPSQAQLVVAVGQQTLSTWTLLPGRVTIGRASDNEFRLDACFVSRHHCRVTTVGRVSTIEDLQSVNGISINGKPVKRHVLKHADRIQLGDHTLTYMLN